MDNTEFGSISDSDLLLCETEILQREAIKQRVEQLFGVQLKEGQLEAIHTLLHHRSDLILIAKTGYGKSIIFQSMPLLGDAPKICLIVMPLKALQDEQCNKLGRINRAKPFVLNGDSNTKQNRRAIGQGCFTHSMPYNWHVGD